MTDLYLIAHKVRGEPAFDIATHLTCPKCEGTDDHCSQCDGAGHWWIIPTSGHRAFPWWHSTLSNLRLSDYDICLGHEIEYCCGTMPTYLRDHYTTEREASLDLIKVLGLIHAPLAPVNIKRRL